MTELLPDTMKLLPDTTPLPIYLSLPQGIFDLSTIYFIYIDNEGDLMASVNSDTGFTAIPLHQGEDALDVLMAIQDKLEGIQGTIKSIRVSLEP